MAYDDIIAFWFDELEPSQWWKVDTELDRRIARRFGAVHGQATRGELAHWRDSPAGRLAEVLVLDQFSRNMPKAFAQAAMALVLAQEAVRTQADRAVDIHQRRFFYMPHMHSESAEIHRQAIELFDQPGLEDNLRFELLHRDIIQRFGRYPHRNAILGRPSTQAELEFLQQPGSSF